VRSAEEQKNQKIYSMRENEVKRKSVKPKKAAPLQSTKTAPPDESTARDESNRQQAPLKSNQT
jgi:hypothetical protein